MARPEVLEQRAGAAEHEACFETHADGASEGRRSEEAGFRKESGDHDPTGQPWGLPLCEHGDWDYGGERSIGEGEGWCVTRADGSIVGVDDGEGWRNRPM